jgi:multiple sugar transport system permease protein
VPIGDSQYEESDVIESAPTVPVTQVHPAVQTRARSRRRIQWSAYLYILPAFVIISAFHIIPVFYAIYISLNKGPINKWKFVGLENYIRAFSGAEFWSSLGTTFTYSLLTMPFTIMLGLFFAYLLYQGVRGRGVYRVIFFLPYVVSTVGSAIVWAWVFDPQSGLANFVLKRIGIEPLRWLIEPTGVGELIADRMGWTIPTWAHGPSLALIAISIFAIWQAMGYDVVIFLAGLTNIPGELYEAARMDGANGVQLFRHITLPMLAPTTFFVIVISVIYSLQSFNHIFAMNHAAAQSLGGPLGSTGTLTVYMFDQLYTYSNYGYASAIAIILSLIILALTLFNFRILGRRVQY